LLSAVVAHGYQQLAHGAAFIGPSQGEVIEIAPLNY